MPAGAHKAYGRPLRISPEIAAVHAGDELAFFHGLRQRSVAGVFQISFIDNAQGSFGFEEKVSVDSVCREEHGRKTSLLRFLGKRGVLSLDAGEKQAEESQKKRKTHGSILENSAPNGRVDCVMRFSGNEPRESEMGLVPKKASHALYYLLQ